MKPPLNVFNFYNGLFSVSNRLCRRGMATLKDLDPVTEKQRNAIEEFRRSRQYSEKYSGLAPKEEQSNFQKMIDSIKPLNFIKDTEWTIENLGHIMKNMKRSTEIQNQTFDPLRYEVLGYEIGAAHFVVYRKGAVKFEDQPDWIRWTTEAKYSEVAGLPFVHQDGYRVEGIDLSNIIFHYEGLKNLEPLKHLKHLAIDNNSLLDDWYLDVISNFWSLEHLSLRNCPRISHRGIANLHKLNNLRTLLIGNDKESPSKEMQLAVLNLLDYMPELYVDIDPTSRADTSAEASA